MDGGWKVYEMLKKFFVLQLVLVSGFLDTEGQVSRIKYRIFFYYLLTTQCHLEIEEPSNITLMNKTN